MNNGWTFFLFFFFSYILVYVYIRFCWRCTCFIIQQFCSQDQYIYVSSTLVDQLRVFLIGFTYFHPHQLYMRLFHWSASLPNVALLLGYLMFSNLISEHLMTVLICIYLVTSEIEQLFICLLAIWLSFCIVPVQILGLLFNYVCRCSLYTLEW